MSISSIYDHPKLAGKVTPLAHGGEPPHDGGMEARVARLEDAMIASCERLARIEATLPSLATKADLEKMGRVLILWFVGTSVALAGTAAAVAFAIAKLVH